MQLNKPTSWTLLTGKGEEVKLGVLGGFCSDPWLAADW
jgi:hypothetical protein